LSKYTVRNIFLALIASGVLKLGFANNIEDFPCLIVKNGATNSFITHDPNWDDQILVVNKKKIHDLHVMLKPYEEIKICGTYSEFGIIFEGLNQQYIATATISNNNLELTAIDLFPQNQLKYQVQHQSKSLLEIELLN
jgi:hypothetical protein